METTGMHFFGVMSQRKLVQYVHYIQEPKPVKVWINNGFPAIVEWDGLSLSQWPSRGRQLHTLVGVWHDSPSPLPHTIGAARWVSGSRRSANKLNQQLVWECGRKKWGKDEHQGAKRSSEGGCAFRLKYVWGRPVLSKTNRCRELIAEKGLLDFPCGSNLLKEIVLVHEWGWRQGVQEWAGKR